jgi:hypothetical protein
MSFPRTNGTKKCQTIFFGDIVNAYKTPEEYVKSIEQLKTDGSEIKEQLSVQIWQISEIAKCKYDCVKQSVGFLIIGIGFSLAVILLIGWV